MKTAYRKDLIHDALRRADGQLSLRDIELSVALYEESQLDALRNAYKVQLPGFLTLYPAVQKPRKGRNAQTGEPMEIPARATIRFRPGRALKDVASALTIEAVQIAETENYRMPSQKPEYRDVAHKRPNQESVTDVLNARNNAE